MPVRSVSVRDRPPADRPRERLAAHGASVLADHELLALVLRNGSAAEGVVALAQRLLADAGGVGGLSRLGPRELARVPGVGEAKAAGVVAAFELARRSMAAMAMERAQITGPADAAALLVPRLAHLDHEESIVLVLDRRHRLLRGVVVGVGGVAHAPMEPREVLQAALREPAAATVLVAHNHPSGDPEPSSDDLAVTQRLEQAAKLVGLDFLDHLIVASRGWRSLRTGS
ncbi:MAG TPA: DNA repair protein RadC [Actinomycetota bacterium]|nr:DNA repair protein RadC [Actinomycetota bacterium]